MPKEKAFELFLPVDTRDRTRVDRLLNEIFSASFGLDHLGLLRFLVEPEDLGADLFARAAPDAFVLIDVDFVTHLRSPLAGGRAV